MGEIANVSDDELVLAFGDVAWGSGLITLPVRTTSFNYASPDDRTSDVPAHNSMNPDAVSTTSRETIPKLFETVRLVMVPRAGVEPARPFGQRILSP